MVIVLGKIKGLDEPQILKVENGIVYSPGSNYKDISNKINDDKVEGLYGIKDGKLKLMSVSQFSSYYNE